MKLPIAQKRFQFIGCEIIYREACHLAARCGHRVDVQFLPKGLHDLETRDMLSRIQQTVDQVEPDQADAILLGYARCNDGLVGLEARSVPLVIPRAHDCITLFFGSRDRYMKWFQEHPGTYYMTTGWAERENDAIGSEQPAFGQTGVMKHLGLTESYADMVARYGKNNADYILSTLGDWRKNYTDLLYLEMGVCDESPFIDAARAEARENGWTFRKAPGDLSLLERLFGGEWDEDFVIIPPGGKLVARNDNDVLDVQMNEKEQ
ncbi:MAG: DUF1638 domain-containing protein [Phycisphaerae bacterium]